MNPSDEPTCLEDLLDRLIEAGDEGARVSLGDTLAVAGRRAFGTALLVPGLIALSPLSGIPGLPTTMAMIVLLCAGQLLLGRRDFWLPLFILNRTLSRERLVQAVKFLRPGARFVDRLTRARLRALTDGLALYFIAACAALVAVTIPPLELVPFAATLAGAALTAFGLSLISHDGVLALLALLLYAGTLGGVLMALLG